MKLVLFGEVVESVKRGTGVFNFINDMFFGFGGGRSQMLLVNFLVVLKKYLRVIY